MSYVDIRLLFRSSISINDIEETSLEYLGPGQIVPTNSESMLMKIVATIIFASYFILSITLDVVDYDIYALVYAFYVYIVLHFILRQRRFE